MTVHHVFANRSNIGDWLSAQGIQALLGVPDVREHFCDAPFVEETILQLAEADEDDLILIGGGGLLMDYFLPFWDAFVEIADRLRYVLWGVGAVDLKREASLPPVDLIERVVAGSLLTVVRDDLTRDLLAAADLPPPVPCPSMLAVPRAGEPGWGVLHVANYTTAGADVHDTMRAEARSFAERTSRPFRETNNLIEPGRRDQLDRTLGMYRDSDLIVSSGLHGCILGLAVGRPVVAVSGDRKLDSFMAAAGLSRWVLSQEETGRLGGLLENAFLQPDTAGFVRRGVEANRRVAAQVRDLLRPRHRQAAGKAGGA